MPVELLPDETVSSRTLAYPEAATFGMTATVTSRITDRKAMKATLITAIVK